MGRKQNHPAQILNQMTSTFINLFSSSGSFSLKFTNKSFRFPESIVVTRIAHGLIWHSREILSSGNGFRSQAELETPYVAACIGNTKIGVATLQR